MDEFVKVESKEDGSNEVFRRKRTRVPEIRRTLSVLLCSLQGTDVIIELKNDSEIFGTVDEVDAYMNFVLTEAKQVFSNGKISHSDFMDVKGNAIRYVHIPEDINCTQHVSTYVKGLDRLQKTSQPHLIKERENKRPKLEISEEAIDILIND